MTVTVLQRLQNCRSSLEGAQVSGARLLRTAAQTAADTVAARQDRPANASPERLETMKMQVDKLAMISFLSRAHVQLAKLADTPGLSPEIAAAAAFRKSVPDAYDLRNMVEHPNQFEEGENDRKRKKWTATWPPADLALAGSTLSKGAIQTKGAGSVNLTVQGPNGLETTVSIAGRLDAKLAMGAVAAALAAVEREVELLRAAKTSAKGTK